MPSQSKLVAKLQQDYPELTFTLGQRETFHPPKTIIYTSHANPLLLLHELGHYIIHRTNFSSDIELIQIESLAWNEAKKLSAQYGIEWDEDFAQDHLDSYRDYLYTASLCPDCNITGYQDDKGDYHCPLCNKHWPSPGRPED